MFTIVKANAIKKDDPCKIKLLVGKSPMTFRLDTGVDEKVISLKIHKKTVKKTLTKSTSFRLMGAGNTKLKVHEKVKIPIVPT